ncbi:hypothetical protein [Maribellus sp. YY47]|uniref:hypothetical protein n=1 Tax=Maribellus sp. YY47 TaxID=2929486 RepID=UPI0020019930|nr:hypothetical protein [Maribellus sp. YY47]MCK3685373.1 hypothetical protein [Maribellus sp. YY47]
MIKSASLLLPIYVTFMWTLVFLFQKRTHLKANKVLGVLMLSACTIYLTLAAFFLHYYQLYSFIECLYFLTLLSLYPLFYLYVLLLASNKIRFERYFVHFLPGIIFCIFSLAFTLLLNHNQRLDYITKVLVDGKMKGMNFASIEGLKGLMNLMVRLIFIAQSLVYLLASIRITNKHTKELNEYYSNIEGRSVH